MSAKNAWGSAGRFAREIVAQRVTIVTVVGLILGYIVAQGWVAPSLSQTIQDDIAGGLALVGALTGILWARTGTTPADPALLPLSKSGRPLVEAVEANLPFPGKPQPGELPHNAA